MRQNKAVLLHRNYFKSRHYYFILSSAGKEKFVCGSKHYIRAAVLEKGGRPLEICNRVHRCVLNSISGRKQAQNANPM